MAHRNRVKGSNRADRQHHVPCQGRTTRGQIEITPVGAFWLRRVPPLPPSVGPVEGGKEERKRVKESELKEKGNRGGSGLGRSTTAVFIEILNF